MERDAHICELYSALKDLADELDGRVLRLFIQVRRGHLEHAPRYRLWTGRAMSDGGGAACVPHLMTRTDQPRLAGCALSTPSSSARFSGVSVLESLLCCYVESRAQKAAHLRSQAGRGRPSMRQGSTRRRIRGGPGRGRGRPRRRRGCTGRKRWEWGSGGSTTLSCQPRVSRSPLK
jgi:hypothetical protein